MIIDWIKDNRIIAAVIAAAVLTGIILILRIVIRRSRRNRELAIAAEDKRRDENLNNVILNSYAGDAGRKEVYVPYDVDYSNSEADGRKNKKRDGAGRRDDAPMLQLIEKTELSTRKFMLNPVKGIHIGSDSQINDIAVLAAGIAPQQCEIFVAGGKVYIRDLGGGNRTILRRKKEQAIVDHNGVRLLSGDVIVLGSVTYKVTIKG